MSIDTEKPGCTCMDRADGIGSMHGHHDEQCLLSKSERKDFGGTARTGYDDPERDFGGTVPSTVESDEAYTVCAAASVE